MEQPTSMTIRDLYPELTETQLHEAEANLERFLAVMLRISERLSDEGCDLSGPDLTVSKTGASGPPT